LQCGYTNGFMFTRIDIFFVHIYMNFLVDEFFRVTLVIQKNSEFICIPIVTLANLSTKKFIPMCTNKCMRTHICVIHLFIYVHVLTYIYMNIYINIFNIFNKYIHTNN